MHDHCERFRGSAFTRLCIFTRSPCLWPTSHLVVFLYRGCDTHPAARFCVFIHTINDNVFPTGCDEAYPNGEIVRQVYQVYFAFSAVVCLIYFYPER